MKGGIISIDYFTSRRDYVKEKPKIRIFNIKTKDTIDNNWMVGISKILALNVSF